MTVDDVLIQYQDRLHELQTGIHQLRLPHALTVLVLAIAIILVFTFSLSAIRGQISFLWPPLPILAAGASARRLQQNRRSRSRMWRLELFYARAVERVKGNWLRSGATGEEFEDPDHVYAADLHLFGGGSLLELLCIARTSIGKRGLANYLLAAPAVEETLLRQEAVRELTGRVGLREKIATLGEFEFTELKWSTFEDWLSSPKLSFPRPLPLLAGFTSALLALLVLTGFDHLIPWIQIDAGIGILIAIHALVGLAFQARVNATLASVRPVCGETRVLRDGLAKEQFQSVKLQRLAEQVRKGSASIRKLEWLLGGLTQRDKEWFYLPSRVLLVGTQLSIAIEQWKTQHGDAMREWLEAWAEFEALSALAAYGYENPDNAFPDFADAHACFEARERGHPLLSHTACVVNDVELTSMSRFYVISGSNMSGKSTLLRAIGLNAVLAFAGAPVRAANLRLSGLSIFASLSIVDLLLNGKSKFLAEVDRLRLAIEAAANTPVLFLVDEIFAGTNSRDRRIAAEAVVRTLVSRGAIGALSTHDLALTEITTAEGMCGANVHMGSRDGRDPMDFDYLLKPGVTQEANALAIARMAGVPI